MVIDEKDLRFDPLTKKELDSLRLFHEKVTEINESRIIKTNSLKGEVYIELNPDGIKKDANLPDEDDLRSLLLLISPLVRTNERTHYNNIISILANNAKNEDTRSYFKLLQERYSASLNSGLRYGANGKEYSDVDIFKLLINGRYFHCDDNKRDKLKDLEGLPYAAEGALLGTLCVHMSWLRLINRIIADRILTSEK